MEVTLQELAARVGMTPRNIREWQTIGVLHTPLRRGRVAYYDDSHVNRIERIKSLRADGFPLDIIRQYMEHSEGSAADVLALSSAVLDPSSHATRVTIDRTELTERLGGGAEAALLECGLIELAGEKHAVIKDEVTYAYVEQLAAFGLPVEAITTALDAMIQHQIAGVSALIELYREEVWQPFVDAGMPAAQWRTIAENSGRMRDLVVGLGNQTLRHATDAVIGEVAVQQASKLESSG